MKINKRVKQQLNNTATKKEGTDGRNLRIFRDTNVYHEASGFGHLEVIPLLMLSFLASKVEPQFNEPLHNEVNQRFSLPQ